MKAFAAVFLAALFGAGCTLGNCHQGDGYEFCRRVEPSGHPVVFLEGHDPDHKSGRNSVELLEKGLMASYELVINDCGSVPSIYLLRGLHDTLEVGGRAKFYDLTSTYRDMTGRDSVMRDSVEGKAASRCHTVFER